MAVDSPFESDLEAESGSSNIEDSVEMYSLERIHVPMSDDEKVRGASMESDENDMSEDSDDEVEVMRNPPREQSNENS